ncbi:MAG: sulfite exporter TauE/SafE family protein [Bacteroidota bacterium]
MNILWTAITLGFLGSFHCVGMCGPIALALPINQNSYFTKFLGVLLYNIGRMFTYAMFGALFGLVGQTFVIAGYQQGLSITLGIVIVAMVIMPVSISNRFKITASIYSFIGNIKKKLGSLFQQKTNSSLFFIGTLNGLLPCGLVYLGIAGAIATGNGIQGSVFMAMFGLGTFPAMILLSLLGNTISISFRSKIRKVMPVFVVCMGLLLILRGMNIGIPYVSPEMSATKVECHKCCHK